MNQHGPFALMDWKIREKSSRVFLIAPWKATCHTTEPSICLIVRATTSKFQDW
uniref:Uncharacterized protein n=1 Tax=Arundo donax TaxID=35708 RepID=A0A0A9AKE3_ARUDO